MPSASLRGRRRGCATANLHAIAGSPLLLVAADPVGGVPAQEESLEADPPLGIPEMRLALRALEREARVLRRLLRRAEAAEAEWVAARATHAEGPPGGP